MLLAVGEGELGAQSVALAAEAVVLVQQRPDAFTREELMRDVWGHTAELSRTLDSHASRVRRKLAQAGAPNMIINLWGVGYRLNPSQ